MIVYAWSVWGDICGAGVLLFVTFRVVMAAWERHTDRRGWKWRELHGTRTVELPPRVAR